MQLRTFTKLVNPTVHKKKPPQAGKFPDLRAVSLI